MALITKTLVGKNNKRWWEVRSADGKKITHTLCVCDAADDEACDCWGIS